MDRDEIARQVETKFGFELGLLRDLVRLAERVVERGGGERSTPQQIFAVVFVARATKRA